MTKTFTAYALSRPAITTPLADGDTLLALQGGALKKVDPKYTAVTLDIGGSGKRCQVTARWDGLDDDGNDIWSLVATTL